MYAPFFRTRCCFDKADLHLNLQINNRSYVIFRSAKDVAKIIHVILSEGLLISKSPNDVTASDFKELKPPRSNK